VELPGVATLLDPTVGVGEEPEPVGSLAGSFDVSASVALGVAFSLAAFSTATASSTALWAAASSTGFFAAAAATSAVSFAIASLPVASSSAFLAAVAATTFVASLTVLAALDPPVVIALDAAAIRLGCGAVTFSGTCSPDNGGLPIVDPSIRSRLLRLYRGMSSLDDTSSALPIDDTAFPFPLLEPMVYPYHAGHQQYPSQGFACHESHCPFAAL
jgi:hypothetical protein